MVDVIFTSRRIMADSCIVLNCSCNSYVQAPSKNTNRGTLLCFKTSCDACHHAREEHRPLTELDRFIQAEFAIASRNPCTGQIPVHQVLKSSLFGGYDPIPILNDETPNEIEGEAGVPCPCSGFQYPNSAIVSIMQKHRSSSRDTLNERLSLTVCSHCSHPLINHQWQTTATQNAAVPSFIADNTLRVRLHSSINLNRHINVSDFGALVDVFFEDNMVTLLAVLDSQENGCGLVYQSCRTKDEAFKISVQLGVVKIKSNEKRRSQKGVLRTRKSARLAGKDVDSEEKEKIEQRKKEHEEQMGLITSSVSSLMDSMKTAPVQPLPPDLHTATIQCISSCWVSSSCLLVAAGTLDGRVGTFQTSGTQLDSLSWLNTEGEESSVSCLSFNQTSASEQSRFLCAGYSSGRITLWAVACDGEGGAQERVVYHEFFTSIDLCSSVTLCCWSMYNEGLLVTGSDIGEVAFYKATSPNVASNHQYNLAKRHCSAASISCAIWLDNRVCVIGSHDNLIQVLEVSPPVVSTVGRTHQSLITSYFHSSSEHSITHICTLKGHESFVASLSMTCGQLVSVGWDSQLLVWPTSEIVSAASSSSQALVVGRGKKGRTRQTEKVDLEPTQVFRFGPQRHIRFIPLHLEGVGNNDGGSLMMLALDSGQRTHSLTAALYTINNTTVNIF